VIHILPGCIDLCQPVDVGVNKTLKARMRAKWEDCMLEGDGIVNGMAKEPPQHLIAEWLIDVYMHTPAQTVRNAWMKSGYEWF
jgi:hypothetical protein